MMFACRVRVLLMEGYLITLSKQGEPMFKKTFTLNGKDLVLEGQEGENLHDSQTIIIIANGFETNDKAFKFGHQIKKALLTYGARAQIGIDAGKDQPRFGELPDLGILYDIHGVFVYEESDEPLGFLAGDSASARGVSVKKFEDEFSKAFELVPKLTDKQFLAIELYNLAHFETSLNAQFVTLVSAVECLTEEQKRSDDVIAHVDELIEFKKEKFLAGSLDKGTNQKFMNWLNDMKDESIRQSCKSLVRKFLGEKNAREFDKHYNTRSKIVHEGKTPKGVDLQTSLPELDSLVSRLIYAIITSN